MALPQRPFVEIHRYSALGQDGAFVEAVECPAFDNTEDRARWMRLVASEDAKSSTNFFQAVEGAIAWWPQAQPAFAGLTGVNVFADYLRRPPFAQTGDTVVLLRDGTTRVDWPISDKVPPPTETQRAWTPAGLDAQIAKGLELSVPKLVAQLRSPIGVTPFVGAGMSARFKFPQWSQFLESLTDETVDQDGELARLRAGKDLEALAEQLWKRGENAFQNAIDANFNRDVDKEQLLGGPLAILARLIDGPVITTNFDRVLEDTFQACGRSFANAVHGPRPDSIVRALQRNERALLKIHGDCRERAGRTFTRTEYDRNYDRGASDSTLTRVRWLMYTQRPLLFLGCSLEKDRTVDELKAVQGELSGIEHFAVLAARYRESKLSERRQELAKLGITPLWFAPGDFGRIDRHLASLVELTTSRVLAPARPASAPANRDTAPPLLEVIQTKPRAKKPAASIQRITSAIREGRATFLLGSYVHLGAIGTGQEYYDQMAEHFSAPAALRDRSEVARYVLDRHGPAELLSWYRDFVKADDIAPSRVLQFFAELPRFLRAKRHANTSGITLMTTNYDLVIERALERAGEPYHLFYYLSDGDDDGRFAYRSPDGAELLIERPDRFHAANDDRVCLVKLNGGLVRGEKTPESVCTARGDFERLAGRLPDCLPAGLRARIEGRSLLCLGHGLREIDTEMLIRHVQHGGEHRTSWAVQKDVPQARRDYWAQIGLEILDRDLVEFTDELAAELAG